MDGQITNRDLYEAVRGTEQQIGGLATQVATLVAEWRSVGMQLDSGSKKMSDLEARLRLMEQFRWRIAGAAATTGFVGGGLSALLTWLVTRH